MFLLLFLTILLRLAAGVPTSRDGSSFPSIPGNVSESIHLPYQLARDAIANSFTRPTVVPSKPLRKRDVVQPHPYGDMLPFRISQANQLIINISVGSPPQSVEVVVDTGSDFTWFPTAKEGDQNSSRYQHENSSTWSTTNQLVDTMYVDTSRCVAEAGEDIVSIGESTVRIPLGVGWGPGCDTFGFGILGMSKRSDFLKAVEETSVQPLIFSFSFKDNITGEGENQFAMGGLAGLKEEDIIWIPDKSDRGRWSDAFQLDMPYISYNGQRFNFPPGHTICVDTGATLTVLPGDVLEDFWKVVTPKPSWTQCLNFEKTSMQVPAYDLKDYDTEEFPAMAFRLGDKEWISEVADKSLGPEKEGSSVYLSSVCPDTVFRQLPLGGSDIPSILGGTFFTHLKGLVFDFTPGKERVGMVPRVKLRNKSGLLNPMFVSGASGGNRNWGGFIWIGMMAGLLLAW